jgi:hypothetical protein
VATRRGHIFATFCLGRAGREAGHGASRVGRATCSAREIGSPRRGVGAEAVGEHASSRSTAHPLLVSMPVVIVFS